jgi:large subunit ribosomal protein L24
MRNKIHIRKNDMVVGIAGKERFSKKRGRVLRVFPAKKRAIVEGFNLLKRHMRPTQNNPKGGIIEKESPIHISNIMLYCARCRKGVRTGFRTLADGSRVRYCKSCEEIIDKT